MSLILIKNVQDNNEGGITLTKSKKEKERQWDVRKQDQNSHGKVESFKQLAEEPLEKSTEKH